MTDAVARFRSVISRCLDAFPGAPLVVCRREGKHDGPKLRASSSAKKKSGKSWEKV